jgi:hypothetical protein
MRDVVMPSERAGSAKIMWERAPEDRRECPVDERHPLTIGRDRSNAIAIDSPVVSKFHAVIRRDSGQLVVEDLKSANGTRLNGAPVAMSILKPGDAVEIGAERFVVENTRAGASAGAARTGVGKPLRLAGVALTTLLVGGGLLLLLRPGARHVAAAGANDAARQAPVRAISSASTTRESTPFSDDKAIGEVLANAAIAGVKPSDALYDRALWLYREGRLRDAARVLDALLRSDPGYEIAKVRLQAVQDDLARAVAAHAGEADRLFTQLHYQDAIVEWEAVLTLTGPADPANQTARAGIADAQRRLHR